MNEAAVTQQQGNDIDLAAIGTGSEQMERMRRQHQLKEEYDRRLSALNDRNASANNGNGYSKEQYAQQLAELDKYHQDALEREAQYQEARQRYIGDWREGASRAFSDYAATAANSAELANQAFTNAFQSMEDAFVNFALTGKLSFKDMARSIIADLSRIAAKQAIVGIVRSIGQAWGPQITGFDSGGYTGHGGRLEPAGIVHKGEGVLSQDDMRALGGPSAFHSLRASLRRGYAVGGIGGDAPTSAPVALGGSGGGRGGDVNVEINIAGDGNANVQSNQPLMQQFGKEIGQFVEAKYRELQTRDLRSDGILGSRLPKR